MVDGKPADDVDEFTFDDRAFARIDELVKAHEEERVTRAVEPYLFLARRPLCSFLSLCMLLTLNSTATAKRPSFLLLLCHRHCRRLPCHSQTTQAPMLGCCCCISLLRKCSGTAAPCRTLFAAAAVEPCTATPA